MYCKLQKTTIDYYPTIISLFVSDISHGISSFLRREGSKRENQLHFLVLHYRCSERYVFHDTHFKTFSFQDGFGFVGYLTGMLSKNRPPGFCQPILLQDCLSKNLTIIFVYSYRLKRVYFQWKKRE